MLFNANKKQACLFTSKKSPFTLTPTFQNVSLKYADRLQLLRIEVSLNLDVGRFFESKAKAAASWLYVFTKVRKYFTPGQSSHLGRRWEILDSIERHVIRLIGNHSLIISNLGNLKHRRKVALLSAFYRIHFGEYNSNSAFTTHDLISSLEVIHELIQFWQSSLDVKFPW